MSKQLNDVFKGIALTGQIRGIFDECHVENVYMNQEHTKLFVGLVLREIVHPQMIEALEEKIAEFVAEEGSKVCHPLEPAEVGGQMGQLWSCQIAMNVPQAPFAGTLNVTDAFGGSAALTGQIQSISVASGNGSCTVNECAIPGGAFDPSGTEVIDVTLFVTSTGSAPSFLAENCAIAGYDDGAGNMTVLQPSCVSEEWTPQADVIKTCDPLPAGATPPYTLNCRLDVTANNLPTGGYVAVTDIFAARPPQVATVTAPFMTVTSTDPWDCEDVALNQPASFGICELSAADMQAAGGTSTIEVQITFDVDQTPTQVANCRFIDIADSSVLGAMGLRSAMQSPAANGWPNMPDGCVYIDVPGVPLSPKVEARIDKRCDAPVMHTHNGAQGYLWSCKAVIEVTPSPFQGSFTFDDDASNISVGAAEFLTVSEPGCTGLGTDQLSCTLPGASMTLPHVVSYDLFTEVTDPNQPIEWQNCVKGRAETPAGEFPTDTACVDVTIKPEVTVFDPAKEIGIEKICARPELGERDGQQGVVWNCDVTITAVPAPFSGSFTFFEDASAVTGGAGQIVGISQPGTDWTCLPGVPTTSTNCTIQGADFDPTGQEVLGFELFVPTGDDPITWENCVGGLYLPANGEPREVKGNCEDMTWKPVVDKVPPTFSLKKACQGPTPFGDAQRWVCTIHVTQTGGDPITQPLTLNELFSSITSGNLATQYMLALGGTAGWQCDMPTASCTIQPGAFNGVTGHQVQGIFLIPNSVLAEQTFENCAALAMGDVEVATAPCVPIVIDDAPEFAVHKDCKPAGDPISMGAGNPMQPWQCSLTVTHNGAPFTGTLYLSEELMFGANPGASMIGQVASADPWQCTTGPYGGPGQLALPSCAIPGAQFPASGSSTVTVDLMVPGTVAAQSGAENCVTLFALEDPSSPPVELGESCFTLVDTPVLEPELSITKTCDPAVQDGAGLWNVTCQVTVTGANLPTGEPFRISDVLSGAGNTSVATGAFDSGAYVGPNCGGNATSTGIMAGCDLSTDQLNSAGSITLDYEGTLLTGPGLNHHPGQNCAWVEVPGAGLYAPGNPGDQVCVDIPLTPSIAHEDEIGGVAVPLPGLEDPVDPTGPVGPATPGPSGAVIPGLPTPVPPTPMPEPGAEVTKTCAPLVFEDGAPSAMLNCQIRVVAQDLPAGGTYVITDALTEPGALDPAAVSRVPLAGTFMNLTPAVPGWSCADGFQVSSGQCQGRNDDFMAGGGTHVFDWSAEVLRPADGTNPTYRNCVTLTWDGAPHGMESACVDIPARVLGGRAPEPAPAPAPAPEPMPVPLPEPAPLLTLPVPPRLPEGQVSKSCEPLYFAEGAEVATMLCQISFTLPQLDPNAQVFLYDTLSKVPGSPPTVRTRGPFMTLLNAGGEWDCASGETGRSAGSCVTSGATLNAMDGFASYTWTTEVELANYSSGLFNCAHVTVPGVASFGPVCAQPEIIVEGAAGVELAPPGPPRLEMAKELLGDCRVQRSSQLYECLFRVTVANTGRGNWTGALAVQDQFTGPALRGSQVVQANGWSCGPARGGALSCQIDEVTLAPGTQTHFDVALGVAGLRDGGTARNCVRLGVGDDPRTRIAMAQRFANAQGFDAGTVDGVEGPRTRRAVARLRSSLGLPPGGVDDALFEALGLPADGGEACAEAPLAPMPAPPTPAPAPVPTPEPLPVPIPEPVPTLSCEKGSTVLRDGECVCIDQRNARKVSETQCRCKNGGPMVGGRCITVTIPIPGTEPGHEGGAAGDEGCRLRVNGICIKR